MFWLVFGSEVGAQCGVLGCDSCDSANKVCVGSCWPTASLLVTYFQSRACLTARCCGRLVCGAHLVVVGETGSVGSLALALILL